MVMGKIVLLIIIYVAVVVLCYRYPKKRTNNLMPEIFQLTPMTELEDGNQLIYNKYLDSVFHNKDILNVAITGGKGFGKSSVIRSFENYRKKHLWGECDTRNKDFLYITLGNDCESEEVKLDEFEHRLLIQIYSRFHKKDLPFSYFRLIQESGFIENGLFAFGITVFAIGLTLIVFRLYIGKTIISINNQNNALDIIVNNRHWIILFLYLVVLLLGAFIIYHITKIVLLNIRYRDIKLREGFTGTELEINGKSGQYLDKCTMDLIYCLEAVFDKIDGTVVFEDFDRYEPKIYGPVFFRLREINESINRRIKVRDCKKALRFIYVVNNDSLNQIEYQKFFDYVLAVSPHYNIKTAEKIIEDSLDRLHKNFCDRYNIEPRLKDVRDNGQLLEITTTVASGITDRRLLNTIMNDYSLMADAYYNSKLSKISNEPRDSSVKEDLENELYLIFAFAIFKNMYVRLYNNMWDGNAAEIIDSKGNLQFDFDGKHKEIENMLRSRLTARCFYYVGLDEEQIAEMIISNGIFESGEESLIATRIGIAKKEDHYIIGRIKEQLISLYQDEKYDISKKRKCLQIVLSHFASIHYNDVSWIYSCILRNSEEKWGIELLKDLLSVCGKLKNPFYDGRIEAKEVCKKIRIILGTIDLNQLVGVCYTINDMNTQEYVNVYGCGRVMLSNQNEMIIKIKSRIDQTQEF